ncbi:MAG: alpha-L-arabinofuranosidase, partial [Armatimonadetes bacterium]|nr:alpha-L-arabinofuranosidase [Armatimonadota bacterium]
MRKNTFFALTALAGLLAFGSGPLRAQSPALAAHWTFDEGSGTVAADISGNGNNGTLQGDAGWGPGLVGAHALRLPGRPGSFVDVPAPVVDTTKSFTAAAWVKVNDVSGFQTFV